MLPSACRGLPCRKTFQSPSLLHTFCLPANTAVPAVLPDGHCNVDGSRSCVLKIVPRTLGLTIGRWLVAASGLSPWVSLSSLFLPVAWVSLRVAQDLARKCLPKFRTSKPGSGY